MQYGAQMRPARERGAFVGVNPAASLALFSVAVYRPSAAGSLVGLRGASIAHVNGVISEAELASFGFAALAPASPSSITPMWPPPGGGYDILGSIATGTIGGGPTYGSNLPANTPISDHELLVLPGNVFLFCGPAVNTAFVAYFAVREFANPDEFEQWNVGSAR